MYIDYLKKNISPTVEMAKMIVNELNMRKHNNELKIEKSLWEKELEINIDDSHWSMLLYLNFKILMSTKLHFFQYKIFVRKLMTNLKRSRYVPN